MSKLGNSNIIFISIVKNEKTTSDKKFDKVVAMMASWNQAKRRISGRAT